ncbi:phosphohistidine phosphatase SixA [Shewanella abyssi]|uniref:phosphohistidine phosphatase SixA n=1 Tax=Shewanella abyssi TaxID=311789 RepID=UPI00200CECCE|nr:phosphohistidine phosphatase SixA [Shewanella abyssi]MCL1050769.1 phosphohistidine phosphatase SixA [Shewanella abyssi]
MQLFLMRHGEAGFNAHSDRERTLTDIGRQHTLLMSNWLGQSITEFDLVLVSPYLRAQQSWQEMHKHFPEPRHWLTLDDLVPAGDPAKAAEAVVAYAEHFEAENVLVLAHMPLLGYLVSELVSGVEPPLFSTSGVTLINKQATESCIEWQYAPHMIS